MAAHHGRDQWQKLTLAADRTARSPGSRSTSSRTSARTSRSSAAACRCSAPSCSTRSTSSRPTGSTARPCFTNKTWTDAYRGAGRPGGDVRHRAADGRAGRRGGRRPAGDPREELDQARGVPVHHRRRPEYDSGNYEAATAKAKEMFGYDELRAEQSERRDSGDRVQLGIGVSTFTEMCGLAPSRVLGASTTARAAGSTRASGCCRPARSRSSPGQRRTARATRRRGARSWPTGSGCRSRTSRCCTATPGRPEGPGHLRLTLAGGRRRGDRQGRRQGDREGQAVSQRTCSRSTRTTSSSVPGGSVSGDRPGPD